MKLLYKNCFAFCFLLSHSMHADSLDNFASGLQSIASQSKKTGDKTLEILNSFLKSPYAQGLFEDGEQAYKTFKELLPEDIRGDYEFKNLEYSSYDDKGKIVKKMYPVIIAAWFGDADLTNKLLMTTNNMSIKAKINDDECTLLGAAIIGKNLDIVKKIINRDRTHMDQCIYYKSQWLTAEDVAENVYRDRDDKASKDILDYLDTVYAKNGPEALKRFEKFLKSDNILGSFNHKDPKAKERFKKLLPQDIRGDREFKFKDIHDDRRNVDYTIYPIVISLIFNDTELAKKLLQTVDDISAMKLAAQFDDGELINITSLGIAIFEGNLDIVKMIMEKNKNQKNTICWFDKTDNKKFTPLELAEDCYSGQKDKENKKKYKAIVNYLKKLQ